MKFLVFCTILFTALTSKAEFSCDPETLRLNKLIPTIYSEDLQDIVWPFGENTTYAELTIDCKGDCGNFTKVPVYSHWDFDTQKFSTGFAYLDATSFLDKNCGDQELEIIQDTVASNLETIASKHANQLKKTQALRCDPETIDRPFASGCHYDDATRKRYRSPEGKKFVTFNIDCLDQCQSYPDNQFTLLWDEKTKTFDSHFIGFSPSNEWMNLYCKEKLKGPADEEMAKRSFQQHIAKLNFQDFEHIASLTHGECDKDKKFPVMPLKDGPGHTISTQIMSFDGVDAYIVIASGSREGAEAKEIPVNGRTYKLGQILPRKTWNPSLSLTGIILVSQNSDHQKQMTPQEETALKAAVAQIKVPIIGDYPVAISRPNTSFLVEVPGNSQHP